MSYRDVEREEWRLVDRDLMFVSYVEVHIHQGPRAKEHSCTSHGAMPEPVRRLSPSTGHSVGVSRAGDGVFRAEGRSNQWVRYLPTLDGTTTTTTAECKGMRYHSGLP